MNAATELDLLSGERIREARKAAGLSIQELAHRIGVAFTTLQSWEKGKSAAPASKARVLALELGVSAAYLLCVEETDACTGPLRVTPDEAVPYVELARAAEALGCTLTIESGAALLRVAEKGPAETPA